MDETGYLVKLTMKRTVLAACLISGAAGLLFKDWKVFAGVWIGALMSMAGLAMIEAYVRSLNEKTASKMGAMSNYMVRLIFYALTAGAAALAGIPVLSILAGFAAGKFALATYSFQSRKEAENGKSQ